MTTTPDERTQKVAELMRDHNLVMLTTVAPDGTLISRPMGLQETEFDGDLWFFTAHDARKVAHIAVNPQVNVTVSSSSTWVSLTGTAVEIDDPAKKRALWDSSVEAWFPDGEHDPNIRLIKVDATSAEYWDSPGSRITTAISFAKSKLTGQPYEGDENEKVQL